MSIIEKAVGKLEKGVLASAQVPPSVSVNPDQKLSSGVTETKEVEQKVPPNTFITQNRVNLDLVKMRQYGIVTPDQGRTQIAEQFRVIKRPLLTNAFNKGPGMIKNGNLIMVTSALAGEGKSFCTVNLAMSIAMEMDRTVLLVDADVARPSIPKILGVGTERGLLDILVEEDLSLADVLIKTDVEKLTLLTAGRRHSHSTELLASRNMEELLKELAERYADRVVIFDSPPLLLTSEARVLATQMGQIVLVVEAETTSQQAVRETLRQIESCDVVNLIYNKARTFSGGEYYGYYYHESA
ncbi:exopolysaccharide/PEP-CTERM locus tyrosine autokinase [Nitrosospira multiformis]|uniref:non-specific protein-tyrosine kinase n=1 Tax=Nitrosospira multiformis TaxID=1231 RepID=A0A2T5IG83_9PROT|nr:XrtA-associated tyrosine autokinase [Nitrosospira multiformis]PTQ82815.1 exopolysaccharide/PEP-CTERM locus tyrosine autokinase [Nitrosospira multiformis]